MRSTRSIGLLVALAACTAFGLLPARAAPGPDSHTQPLLDGCQRSDALQLGASTPEWAYVYANDVRMARLTGDQTAGRKTAEGVVAFSRPSGEDLYLDHDFNDYNVLIRPDPAYAGLLGSGNLVPGDEQGLLEGEWEVSAVPLWAWPSAGDRVKLSGNWIWDCGHWGNSAADPTSVSQLLPYDPVETAQDIARPGAIRGETTELHPLYEVATYRAHAAARLLGYGPRAVSWLDAWINGDGTPAQSVEECSLKGINNWALARNVCPRVRDVAGTYTYTMRLSPKPSSASKLIVDPLVVRPGTLPELAHIPVTVSPDARNGLVRIRFTLPHTAVPQRYGLTVVAGWSDAARAVANFVQLSKIHIVRSLDGASEPNHNPFGVPAEQTPDPGEWVLYANVSGHWVQIPKIAKVIDGEDVSLKINLAFFLPPGVRPTLYVSGHECDEPLMDCPHEGTGQPPDMLANQELGFNDHPGRIQAHGFGVPMNPGFSVYRPPANPDPSSGNEDLSDSVCGPQGCYSLTVAWYAPRHRR